MKLIEVKQQQQQPLPISPDVEMRKKMENAQFIVKLSGLELAAIKCLTGKVVGDNKCSIRRETDKIYYEAKSILREQDFPYEHEDLQDLLNIRLDGHCKCNDLPERMEQ